MCRYTHCVTVHSDIVRSMSESLHRHFLPSAVNNSGMCFAAGHRNRTYAMALNNGHINIWRNTRNLQVMALCCQKPGESNVYWLSDCDRKDLDCLGELFPKANKMVELCCFAARMAPHWCRWPAETFQKRKRFALLQSPCRRTSGQKSVGSVCNVIRVPRGLATHGAARPVKGATAPDKELRLKRLRRSMRKRWEGQMESNARLGNGRVEIPTWLKRLQGFCVDGSGCLWQMFRSCLYRIVFDTNKIRFAGTNFRCNKATCQHKFGKRYAFKTFPLIDRRWLPTKYGAQSAVVSAMFTKIA